jgi:hypothetical protein
LGIGVAKSVAIVIAIEIDTETCLLPSCIVTRFSPVDFDFDFDFDPGACENREQARPGTEIDTFPASQAVICFLFTSRVEVNATIITMVKRLGLFHVGTGRAREDSKRSEENELA